MTARLIGVPVVSHRSLEMVRRTVRLSCPPFISVHRILQIRDEASRTFLCNDKAGAVIFGRSRNPGGDGRPSLATTARNRTSRI